MPKIVKRRNKHGLRKKYHYKFKQKGDESPVEGYRKIDTCIDVESKDRQEPSSLPCSLESADQSNGILTISLPVQVESISLSKSVQVEDTPDGDHGYALSTCPSLNQVVSDESRMDIEPAQGNDSQGDIHIEDGEVSVETTTFRDFVDELKSKKDNQMFLLKDSGEDIKLMQLYDHASVPAVKLSVTIDSAFNCRVYVHRKEIPKTHEVWEGLPSLFDSVKSVWKLFEKLEMYRVCIGNPEEEYNKLGPVGCGFSSNTSTDILAYREGDFQAIHPEGFEYTSTVRSVNCTLLTSRKTKCSKCRDYSYPLKRRAERLKDRLNSDRQYIHTQFKHKDMTRTELTKKLFEQKDEIKSLQHEIWKLKRQYQKAITSDGVVMKEHESQEIFDLMSSCQSEFQKSFPDSNCRQRLFWEQQTLQNSKADKRGMRWHPMIIRWCLYMHSKSEKAYDAIRESGFVNLPSKRTLFDYSHFLKSELGLQADVIQLLRGEAEKFKLYDAEWRKYVGLLFDEIKVKEDLVYDKHTGELIGYCNLGDFGNQMLEFEKSIDSKKQNLAKFVLVVMLRSLSSSLCFPVCGFATNSITADYLYSIIWNTVNAIETQLDLHVLFFTSDGASPNRRFYKMHRVGAEGIVYKTANPYNDMDESVFFISDVPHLLKCIRNNFCNSFSHKNTRKLWRNGKDISWFHIVRFFEEHCELQLFNPCPKITRNHIDLVSFNFMKVNLAAQIISDSVANSLEDLYGSEVSETVDFIRIFNKFFDCLNVRSLYEGRNKRNPDLNPYTEINDERLLFLKEKVLAYLEEWKDQVASRNGNFTNGQRAAMMLSHQTVTGITITINSICECVDLMISKGASFILTHSFNQDPLEQHFGHYRHKSGANHNPSVYNIRNTMSTLRTVHAQAIAPKQGNIKRGQIHLGAIDDTPVPKRK